MIIVAKKDLIGRITEADFMPKGKAAGTMGLTCEMEDGSTVILSGIEDARVSSLSRVEVTYRIETPETAS